MKTIFLGLFLASASATPAAFASDFNGHWQGTGLLGGSRFTGEIETKVSVMVEEKENHFMVTECWEAQVPGLKGECISTDYERSESDQLFHGGRKVGDIFPDRIVILESNSQVAEQMVFQRTGEDSFQLDYSYVNMDGASLHRKSRLARVP